MPTNILAGNFSANYFYRSFLSDQQRSRILSSKTLKNWSLRLRLSLGSPCFSPLPLSRLCLRTEHRRRHRRRRHREEDRIRAATPSSPSATATAPQPSLSIYWFQIWWIDRKKGEIGIYCVGNSWIVSMSVGNWSQDFVCSLILLDIGSDKSYYSKYGVDFFTGCISWWTYISLELFAPCLKKWKSWSI